jgi:hypothetical protein
MADFMTRLAERTLGVAPAVQPLISPTFATKQTDQSLDLEWDSEATALPVKRTSAFPVSASTPGRRVPQEALEGAARGEEQDPGVRAAPPRSGASELPPDPSHTPEVNVSTNRKVSGQQDNNRLVPAAPDRPQRASVAGTVEGGAAESEEEERKAPPVTPLSPQKALEPQPGPPPRPNDTGSIEPRVAPGRDRQDPPQANIGRRPPTPPETSHHAQTDTTRRRVLPASPRRLTETSAVERPPAGYETTRGPSRPLRTVVEGENADSGRGIVLAPVLSPGNGVSPDVGRATAPEPEASPDHSTPDAPLSVAPRTIRLRLAGYPERGPQEEGLLVTAPEPPAPTIRVSIGRIEVRAITPPPAPPVQRARSARPGPELSLDDYLKQRNGRQR